MALCFHADVDAMFCQVEQRRDPSLRGRAFAVQQHQDIIAVNYPARHAGVVKHMSPAEARALLRSVGGCLVHVHTEAGGRISYEPYRQAGRQLLRLLQGLAWASVVEKGSIDEAYLLYTGGPGQSDNLTATTASQLGESIRQTVLAQLSLTASVGVAHNKTLAKLASAAAKPDGLHVAISPADVQALLQRTPAKRLPQAGGKDSHAFARAGISCVADLQGWSEQQLRQELGFTRERARQLAEWGWGRCSLPVTPRQPPKSLSVQMSLTPIPLPMHPSFSGRSVCDDDSATGMLEPLAIHADNFSRRLAMLLTAMSGDLMQRIVLDSQEEERWPSTMTLALNMSNPPKPSRLLHRTCRFPASSLSSHMVATDESAGEQKAPLHVAMHSNAASLATTITSSAPQAAKITQVSLQASGFGALAAASAPSVRSFFGRAPKRRRSDDAAAGSAAQHQEAGLPGAGAGAGALTEQELEADAEQAVSAADCMERDRPVGQLGHAGCSKGPSNAHVAACGLQCQAGADSYALNMAEGISRTSNVTASKPGIQTAFRKSNGQKSTNKQLKISSLFKKTG